MNLFIKLASGSAAKSRNPSYFRAPGNSLTLYQCDCVVANSNMDPLNVKGFISNHLKKVDLAQISLKDVRNQIHERLIDQEVFISRFTVEGFINELIPKPTTKPDQAASAEKQVGDFVHKCHACSKRFISANALKVHFRKHVKNQPNVGGCADQFSKVGTSNLAQSTLDATDNSDSEEERLPPPVFYVKGDFIAVAQRDYYAEDYSFTDTSRGNVAFQQEAACFFNRKFNIRREVEALALPSSLSSPMKQPSINPRQVPKRTPKPRSSVAAGRLQFSPPQQVKLAPVKPFRDLCRFCQWPEANSLRMLRHHIQNFHVEEYLLDIAYQDDVIAGIVEPLDC